MLRCSLMVALVAFGTATSGCPSETTTGGDSITPDATVEIDGQDASPDTGPDEDTAPEADTAPECVIASDCAPIALPMCEEQVCTGGVCGTALKPAGAACDDGDLCTTDDVCDGVSGTSCAGTATACDDGNDCTVDACDAATGVCVNDIAAAAGTSCEDGSPCTTGDVCSSAGTCLGTPVNCSGGSGCMVGACDEATGECDVVPNEGAACDDGDICTVLDACDDAGECVGSDLPCDDGVDCTLDACDPSTGTCTNTVDVALCDDGNPCTTALCDATSGCTPIPVPSCCNDNSECYDGNPCTDDVCDTTANTCSFNDNGLCCTLDTDCDPNQVCVDGACFDAGDPTTDYGFPRPATWVSNLDLGGVEGAEPCCFDFNGDGVIDNKVGEITDALSTLIGQGGVNDALDAVILNGVVNLLFAYPPGTPGFLPDAATISVEAFQGDAEGAPSLPDKMNGLATFTVPLDNFLPGTAQAVGSFGTGSIAANLLTAGPGKLYEVPLQVLYFDFSQASMDLATIEGPLATQGPGLSVTGGKLGGVLPMIAVWNAINAFVSTNCDCLNLPGPMMVPVDEATAACNTVDPAQTTCALDGGTEEVCATLNDFCQLALLLVTADYDLDGNGTNDGMTVGIWFDGSGTEITGLTP